MRIRVELGENIVLFTKEEMREKGKRRKDRLSLRMAFCCGSGKVNNKIVYV